MRSLIIYRLFRIVRLSFKFSLPVLQSYSDKNHLQCEPSLQLHSFLYISMVLFDYLQYMIYAALQDEKHKTRFVPWWMHISEIASLRDYEGLIHTLCY